MPRRPSVFIEGGIYHLYNRFARGAELFAGPEEEIEFIELLRRARDRDGLRIYAWALMSNHEVPDRGARNRTVGSDGEIAGRAAGQVAGSGESMGNSRRHHAIGVRRISG
jgi:hypothetical protein